MSRVDDGLALGEKGIPLEVATEEQRVDPDFVAGWLANLRVYEAGRKSAARGAPFDKTEATAWKNGWNDYRDRFLEEEGFLTIIDETSK